ncbi:hypothetical protein AABB24_015511 [Solanum stoloniferum]|uniref:Uncharacterized protein n=1 Tax=Solanum stoloniferum TaxID=62892 RepID=A0ABD2TPT4_9SOLN
MAAAAEDWAGLPHDLLVLIAKHVKLMEDFIAFSGVCTSWRTASTKDNFDMLYPQLPLLMLPDKDDDYREFYSLSKGKVSRRLYLPEAKGRECFPSDQMGWLLTQSLDGKEVSLLNPFSRTQIQLPNQFALSGFLGLEEEEEEEEEEEKEEEKEYRYIRNAILSANPSFTSDYVLVIAYNTDVNHLAFWRPGDINWTEFEIVYRIGGVSNMIYYKSRFYLVSWSAEIGIIDVQDGPEPRVESRLIYLNDNRDLFSQGDVQYYLVEVNDALLLVVRFGRKRPNIEDGLDTFKCEVYELDAIEGKLKEINDLGDSTIFLGLNGATSIDSTKFTGVKPNHIYFTDDWFEENYFLECGGGTDTGAYNLEDGSIESFYPGLSLSRPCPPTWVIPSL